MNLTRALLRAATAFFLMTASLTAVVVTAGPAHAYDTGDEAAFVGNINQVRASRGLPALAVDGQLTNVARSWAAHMAASGSLSHNPNLGSQAPGGWKIVEENVGMGPNAASIEAGFASSAPHYANMTNPQVSQVGVGVVPNNGALWVVEDFWGNGSSAAPPPPPPPRTFAPVASRSAPAGRTPVTTAPAPARRTPVSTAPAPAAAPEATTTTTATAPPVNLDSAAQQIQYFDTWD